MDWHFVLILNLAMVIFGLGGIHASRRIPKLEAEVAELRAPDVCLEKTVTTSELGDVTMQACQMGAPQIAEWMKGFPAYRLAGWKCQFGERAKQTTL